MLQQAAVIFITAILSSLFTVVAVYGLYKWKIRQELDKTLATAREEIEETLAKALEDIGAEVEEGVKRGVVKGVASIPSTEVLTDTTRSVAKTGADLAERGLKALWGSRKRRD